MRDLRNKIAYLQGLAEGLDLDTSTKEGRILTNIIEILDDMAFQLEELQDAQIELEDYVETIDEDLYDLEDDFYEVDEEDDDEYEFYDDDDEDYDDEIDYIEVECPKCHDLVYFEDGLLDDDDIIEITCPNCEEIVFRTNDPVEIEVEED